MTKLIILGAGGHGRSVADIADATMKFEQVAMLDDRYPSISCSGPWPVIGPVARLPELKEQGFTHVGIGVGVGNDPLRVEWLNWAKSLGFQTPALVHPGATISRHASLGDGTVVMAKVVVNACATVEEAVILNTGCTVGHDCRLETGSHISAGVSIGGLTRVGKFSWVGLGANVIHSIDIGDNSVVASGSVVVRNIPPGSKVMGVPAKMV